MKYILAVGIIYQQYKNPMQVTIESKRFIDSFTIENDIGYEDQHEARLDTLCKECINSDEVCEAKNDEAPYVVIEFAKQEITKVGHITIYLKNFIFMK